MSDKSEELTGVFDPLLGTWRSEIIDDDTGTALKDGLIEISAINVVSSSGGVTRGVITSGKRTPDPSGDTGGGQFNINGSKVTKFGVTFSVAIKRASSGPQEYNGLKVGNALGGLAVYVTGRGGDLDGQEEGTWVATKQD